MNEELETLLKAWDAYLNSAPAEADDFFQLYRSKLIDAAAARKLSQETLHRMVKRVYQRWAWSSYPKFPKDLRKMRFDK